MHQFYISYQVYVISGYVHLWLIIHVTYSHTMMTLEIYGITTTMIFVPLYHQNHESCPTI